MKNLMGSEKIVRPMLVISILVFLILLTSLTSATVYYDQANNYTNIVNNVGKNNAGSAVAWPVVNSTSFQKDAAFGNYDSGLQYNISISSLPGIVLNITFVNTQTHDRHLGIFLLNSSDDGWGIGRSSYSGGAGYLWLTQSYASDMFTGSNANLGGGLAQSTSAGLYDINASYQILYNGTAVEVMRNGIIEIPYTTIGSSNPETINSIFISTQAYGTGQQKIDFLRIENNYTVPQPYPSINYTQPPTPGFLVPNSEYNVSVDVLNQSIDNLNVTIKIYNVSNCYQEFANESTCGGGVGNYTIANLGGLSLADGDWNTFTGMSVGSGNSMFTATYMKPSSYSNVLWQYKTGNSSGNISFNGALNQTCLNSFTDKIILFYNYTDDNFESTFGCINSSNNLVTLLRNPIINSASETNLYEEAIIWQNNSHPVNTSYFFNTSAGNFNVSLTNLSDDSLYYIITDAVLAENAGIHSELNTSFSIASVPKITLLQPVNNYFSNETLNTFIANVSAQRYIANVSMYIYDSGGLYNFSFNDTFSTPTTNENVSFNQGLVEGIYTWFFESSDTYNFTTRTANRTITVDQTPPIISITYPLATNYTSIVSNLSYYFDEIYPNTCWYTVNGGVTNNTITCGNNVTGLSAGQGSNTWSVYINDSAGNSAFSTITFNVDSIAPNIEYIANNSDPDGSNISRDYVLFNVRAIDSSFHLSNLTGRLYNSSNSLIQSFTNSSANNTFCYQEFADQSTACGGLATGTYFVQSAGGWNNPSQVYDGNWATGGEFSVFGTASIYVNYTRPAFASSAVLQLKDDGGSINITIPSSCISDNVSLQLTSSDASNVVRTSCYNGTAYQQLRLINTVTPTFYEEAMLWNNGITNLFNFTGLSDGFYKFNATAYDSFGNSNSTTTRGIKIDTSSPIVAITYPLNITYLDGLVTNLNNQTINLNWTATDANIQSCWYTQNNGANHSVSCSANTAKINVSYNNYNPTVLTFYANDTSGRISFYSISPYFKYSIYEKDLVYQNISYETATEPFFSNVTWNNIDYGSISAQLIYDLTSQSATPQQSIENVSFTSFVDIPPLTTSSLNQSWFWRYTMVNSTGSFVFNSTSRQIQINPVNFSLCDNSTFNKTYLYLNFQDETTFNFLPAAIDLMTLNYHIGNGTNFKTFYYTNTTVVNGSNVNYNYSFCFTPTNRNVSVDYSILYSSLLTQNSVVYQWPQRTYANSETLYNNASTNRTLLFSSSTAGVSTSFQIISSGNSQGVSGATVRITRNIFGVDYVVGQGTTDNAGGYSAWLTAGLPHTVAVSKNGCSSTTFSVTPSQTQNSYTISISCGTGSTSYNPASTGIKYQRGPATTSPLIGDFTYNFTYYVTSKEGNIRKAKMYLQDENRIAFMSNESFAGSTSFCTAKSCNLTISYTPTPGQIIYGSYWVDSGAGYYALENDANWRFSIRYQNFTTQNVLKGSIHDLNSLFDGWKMPPVSDTVTGWSSAVPNEEYTNVREEFSKIVAFFLLATVLLAVLGRMTSYDAQNPGIFLFFLMVAIIALSLVGGIGGEGFFFYKNLTEYHFINNYILAFSAILWVVGYYFNIKRRWS